MYIGVLLLKSGIQFVFVSIRVCVVVWCDLASV